MQYNNRGGGFDRRDKHSQFDESKLPEGYLKDGYFDKGPQGKTVKTELMWKTAEEIAKGLYRGKPQIKKTQLRKYYDYCKRLQSMMQAKNMGFDAVKPLFAKLLGYVTNALNKHTPLVPMMFKQFVEKNILAVKGTDDFNAFIAHFEMIVAYYPKKD